MCSEMNEKAHNLCMKTPITGARTQNTTQPARVCCATNTNIENKGELGENVYLWEMV